MECFLFQTRSRPHLSELSSSTTRIITIKMADTSTSEPTATAKRKGRATKQNPEAHCLVLFLARNDIVVNGGKMSTKQQEELLKVKAAQCLPELKTFYAHTLKVCADQASILSEIDNDSGEGMMRKAKSIVHYVHNVLSPHWKDPSSFASKCVFDIFFIVTKVCQSLI
jgi:hypothetical protein